MDTPPTLRIFFSSPGDVKLERETARRIVERLQAELGGRVRLEPYFWEHEVLSATRDYQENIPPMDGFGVFVCILWSRLGSPLDPRRHPRPDGGFFESGTEYEFHMARAAHRAQGAPEIFLFRNRTEPRRPSRPKEAREAVDREVDRLDEFITRNLREGEYFTSAVNSYRTLGEFEEKLTAALRGFLEPKVQLAGGMGARTRAAHYSGRPYLGLSAFDFADARVFFGRTAQVGEVVVAFQTQELEARAAGEEGRRFVLVLGASGSGKSSLARAGVLPMLVQPGVIEGAANWRRAIFRPGEAGGDPFLGLAQALLAQDALPELGSDGTDAAGLAGLLRRQSGGAGLLLRQALSQAGVQARHAEELRLREEVRRLETEHREEDVREAKERLARLAPPPVRLALLCDQLEELFTTDQPREAAAAFVECLAALARSGRCFVLATLRSDFYPRCLEHPPLVELMKANGSYALAAPGPAELGQMIRQPAEVAGLAFEANAASGEKLDELLRDAALEDPAALPLLGYTLEQLYERRTPEGLLTLAAYRELGGLEGAIGKRAEAVFAALPGEAQAAFDAVWRQLVTLGQDGEPVRRHAAVSALAASAGAAALVEALVKARLLTADQAAGGERSVTVAHEALLRHWPRVTAWVDSNREFLRARSRLATRLAEWNERGKTDDYLIPSGTALGEAEGLLAAHASVLTDEESDYIRRSSARASAREQARLRRSRAITTGAVTLSVLAMVGGGFAWHERGIAEEQRKAASTNEQRAVAQEKLAVEQKEAAERSAREAHASQTRNAYLLGLEMLEAGKTREGLASLAQTLLLDPEHTGARDRLYSHHLYGLPKAICLFSVEAPEGIRQRITGSRRGPVQRFATIGARGAPEVRELATLELVPGGWSEERAVVEARLDETSRYLLCQSPDAECRIWAVDPPSAAPVRVAGVDGSVLAFAGDGRWLADGDVSGRVRVWSLPEGRLVHEWEQSQGIDALEIDERTGLLTSSGGELVLFDLLAGRQRARVEDPEWDFAHATVSADGSVIAVAETERQPVSSQKKSVRFAFLSALDGTPIVDPRRLDPLRQVFDLALNEDGTRLALASFMDIAVAWDREDPRSDKKFPHETYPVLVRISPDDRLIVTATSDGTVRLFDTEGGLLAFEPIHSEDRIEDLELSWDGRYLLTSTARRARLWDLAVGRALTQPLRVEGSSQALRFTSDGRFLWVASMEAGLQCWNTRTLELERPALFAGSLQACLIDDQARRAAVRLAENEIRLIDLASGAWIGAPIAPPWRKDEWSFCADGSRLMVCGEARVDILDAATGEAAGPPWEQLYASVSLDPHGEHAAIDSLEGVAIRKLASGLVNEFAGPDGNLDLMAFSPDGRWLAARLGDTTHGTQNVVLLWNLEDPSAAPKSVTHGDQVHALAFSPDSRWLATGTREQIARVWDVASGLPACDPIFHPTNVVRSVLFSPDSRRLATLCGDQTMRVFDWREARPVSEVLATGGDTVAWQFSPDGKLLAQVSPIAEGNTTLSFARLFEVAPPSGVALDLVALTEAASALRVTADGLPTPCDPYEGWKRLADSSSDSWFFRSPARRVISPAFDASSQRWILDDSVDVSQTMSAMPAVGMVRAAAGCWYRRELERRRPMLAELDPDSEEGKKMAARITWLERQIPILIDRAGREVERDPSIPVWLCLEAEAASDLPRARRWIEQACAAAPDDREVLEQASDFYRRIADSAAERAVLERLRALAPDDARLRLELGYNLWRSGERERGGEEFTSVLDRPEVPELERVQLLTLLGRIEEALAAWTAASERDPEAGDDLTTAAYYVAGMSRVGDLENAIEMYKDLIPRSDTFLSEGGLRAALSPDVAELLIEVMKATLVRYPELAPE